jgi:late competence protein required for DNA uptake (superfamily II DNA/RNA helicase)
MALLSTCPNCGELNINNLWKKVITCLYCNSVYEINGIKKAKFKKE